MPSKIFRLRRALKNFQGTFRMCPQKISGYGCALKKIKISGHISNVPQNFSGHVQNVP
jgi:hypothetical protein